MNIRNSHLAAIALPGLLAALPAIAQPPSTSTSPSPRGTASNSADNQPTTATQKRLSGPDGEFVTKAAEGGMMEVELGRLATQRASSEEVKSFGQRMIDDHSQANQQLLQIANQKNLTVPTTLPADKKAQYEEYAKLSGAEFDRAYMKHMVEDHQKDIAEFERESKNGKDDAVKGFASQTLPTLREHLQMAQQVATTVGASTASSHASASGSAHGTMTHGAAKTTASTTGGGGH